MIQFLFRWLDSWVVATQFSMSYVILQTYFLYGEITIFTYAIHLFLAVGGSIWDIWLDFEQALEGDYKIITSVMIFWSWLLASTWNLIFCLTFNIWSEHRLYHRLCDIWDGAFCRGVIGFELWTVFVSSAQSLFRVC